MPMTTSCVGMMQEAMAPVRERLSRYSAETIMEYMAFQVVNDCLTLPPWNMLDAIQSCADHRDMCRALDDSRAIARKLIVLGAVKRTANGLGLTSKGCADPLATELWQVFLRTTRRLERLRRKAGLTVDIVSAQS